MIGCRQVVRTLIVALSLLTAGMPASADFDKGVAAFNRGDFKAAFREYKPLAEQGHAPSQNNLGIMFQHGMGVRGNQREAVKWYRRAAEQGHTNAQHNLGLMYARGQGVPKDDVTAYMWFSIAAKVGHTSARRYLGITEKRMTPAQVAKAKEMAATWKPK